VFEFDMVHLVANSIHHKESKPEKRKQSAAPFAQLRGKNMPPKSAKYYVIIKHDPKQL